MRGLSDYITQCDWVDVFTVWYVLVDDVYQLRYGGQRLRQSGPPPVCSDSEVIVLSLICDVYFHGQEELMLSFVKQYHTDLFPRLLSLSRFNRRRRAAHALIEGIRRTLSDQLLDPHDELRLIDSAPIPVCVYARAKRSQTLCGSQYFSVMPTRRAKLFGLRLHLTITDQQIIDQWMLAPAAPRDSKLAETLLSETERRLVFGDNAFRDPTVAAQLKRTHQVELLAPPRQRYEKHPWPAAYHQLFMRVRRRIETSLSVLAGPFHIQQPAARALWGLMTRVASRILAYTLSFITAPLLMPHLN
jgi:DDE family transposase